MKLALAAWLWPVILAYPLAQDNRSQSALSEALDDAYRLAVKSVLAPQPVDEFAQLWTIAADNAQLSWRTFNESPGAGVEAVPLRKRQLPAISGGNATVVTQAPFQMDWPDDETLFLPPPTTPTISSPVSLDILATDTAATQPPVVTVDRVLVVAWTSAPFPSSLSVDVVLGRDLWVTAVPQLRDFCRSVANHPDRVVRVQQYLGMPAIETPTRRMVSLWVRPEDMMRPCPGASLTDTKCATSYVWSLPPPTPSDTPTNNNSSLPNLVMVRADGVADVTVSNWQWVADLVVKTSVYNYANDNVAAMFPWTRLGYTFDWAAEAVGATEFIVRGGSTARIEHIDQFDDYCSS